MLVHVKVDILLYWSITCATFLFYLPQGSLFAQNSKWLLENTFSFLSVLPLVSLNYFSNCWGQENQDTGFFPLPSWFPSSLFHSLEPEYSLLYFIPLPCCILLLYEGLRGHRIITSFLSAFLPLYHRENLWIEISKSFLTTTVWFARLFTCYILNVKSWKLSWSILGLRLINTSD